MTQTRLPPTRRRAPRPIGLAACLVLLSVFGTWPAVAQLRLPTPQIPIPRPPPLPDLDSLRHRAGDVLTPLERLDLRSSTIEQLLRRDRIEADASGQPVVRSEVVALSPALPSLEAARAAGFTVARERALADLGVTVVVLRAPTGVSTAQALQKLRALDPAGTYDFNHLYLGSGSLHEVGAAAGTALAPPSQAIAAQADSAPPRVGLLDGGIDAGHPTLREADLRRHGCEGAVVPTAHGTAVASLLVGQARGFAGAAPAAALYAADVYCGAVTGGAVDALAEALGWMAQQQVRVINISLVGPNNSTLARVVGALLARGHIVVAAVGNDGPAAPPLYPASYPGVVGVTAVDASGEALPEAARGPQVTFAAPGADLAVAASGTRGYAAARGTSFAAPIVAGLLAMMGARNDAQAAITQLARSAIDLGPPGRDTTYGYGLVGAQLRVDPAQLVAATPVFGHSDAGLR